MINREDFYGFIEKAKRYCSKDICRNVQPKSVSDDINNLLKTDADYLYTLVKAIDEYKEPIITNSERDYLKAVIKPFKDRVTNILKCVNLSNTKNYIRITLVSINGDSEYIELPYFVKGSKYECMETNRRYTLEELGLED